MFLGNPPTYKAEPTSYYRFTSSLAARVQTHESDSINELTNLTRRRQVVGAVANPSRMAAATMSNSSTGGPL